VDGVSSTIRRPIALRDLGIGSIEKELNIHSASSHAALPYRNRRTNEK